MWHNISPKKQRFIFPVKYAKCNQAYDKRGRKDKANSCTKKYKSVYIWVFIWKIELHVFIDKISLGLCSRIRALLNSVAYIIFVDLSMIEKNEKKRSKRVGD